MKSWIGTSGFQYAEWKGTFYPETLPASKNCPTLNGEAVDPLQHQEAIVTGFTSTYDLLARHREELLAPSSLWTGRSSRTGFSCSRKAT